MSNLAISHPLLRMLSEQERASLMTGRRASYAKGSIVHLQGEPCNTLDLILEGSALAQSIDKQGNVLTVSEFGLGELIGLNLLFSRRNSYPLTITAKAAMVMLCLQRQTILDLCGSNHDFLALLLENLSDRSVFLADRIKLMAVTSIRQVIIEFLREQADRQGSQQIELPCSKKELAERFGIPRTSLSRELQKMQQAGLISYNRNCIRILSTQLLKN